MTPLPPVLADLLRDTDLANARRFVREHGNDLRHCGPWRQWYVWTGCHWRKTNRVLADLFAATNPNEDPTA
jgi:hypothetical protein